MADTKFIEQAFAEMNRGEHEKMVMTIFDWFDDRLLDSDFPACDGALDGIDTSKADTFFLVAVMSITLAAHRVLKRRASFCDRARKRIELIAPDRVEELMGGFEPARQYDQQKAYQKAKEAEPVDMTEHEKMAVAMMNERQRILDAVERLGTAIGEATDANAKQLLRVSRVILNEAEASLKRCGEYYMGKML